MHFCTKYGIYLHNTVIFCKITENGETVFEIRTLAGSSEHAKNIVDNWKANATEIYPKIMKALNGED